MNTYEKIKIVLLGMVVVIGLLFFIFAAPNLGKGRYQITGGASQGGSHFWVLDTATGDVKQMDFYALSAFYRIYDHTDQTVKTIRYKVINTEKK